MEVHNLRESLTTYEAQLEQVENALLNADGQDRDNLTSLRTDLNQLIGLTRESINRLRDSPAPEDNSCGSNDMDKEFALFMSEIEKEDVTQTQNNEEAVDISDQLKALEGTKCRAPHTHQWGDTVYHNAMVCSVDTSDCNDFENIMVRVLYTNPTHQEMLPCPYFFNTDCKFAEDQCRYSHGEKVAFSKLREYIEPKFELLTIGSSVLAKQPDKLWHRATIKRIANEKCVVKFDTNKSDIELEFHDIFPLDEDKCEECSDESETEDCSISTDDVINMSLLNKPSDTALGDWEKYTKGIGSKLMQKMGYIVGTGLGRNSDGRLDPVTAVILPAGKSLDHCMDLRERAGGDKDLFSVEKKLKRLQKKQELRNQKAYEREQKKVDVFNLLNDKLLNAHKKENASQTKKQHREEIKKETCRNLNVASLKIDEDIKRVEREIYKIKESLVRHSDNRSQVNKNLKMKLTEMQHELKGLHAKALNIKNEQSIRNDKKKMTVF